jgi:hypothetical protein
MTKNVGEKAMKGAIGGDRLRPDHDFSPPQVYKVMSRIQETLEPFFVEEKKTEKRSEKKNQKKGIKRIRFRLDEMLLKMVDAGAGFKGKKTKEFIYEVLKEFLEDWKNGSMDDETLKKIRNFRSEKEGNVGIFMGSMVEMYLDVSEEIANEFDQLRYYLAKICLEWGRHPVIPETSSFTMRVILDYHIMGMRKVFPGFDEECKKIEKEFMKPVIRDLLRIVVEKPAELHQMNEEGAELITLSNKIKVGE